MFKFAYFYLSTYCQLSANPLICTYRMSNYDGLSCFVVHNSSYLLLRKAALTTSSVFFDDDLKKTCRNGSVLE